MLKELCESVQQGHTPDDEEKARLLKAAGILRDLNANCPGFDKALYRWEKWLLTYQG